MMDANPNHERPAGGFTEKVRTLGAKRSRRRDADEGGRDDRAPPKVAKDWGANRAIEWLSRC